jgi:hypothetical protein
MINFFRNLFYKIASLFHRAPVAVPAPAKPTPPVVTTASFMGYVRSNKKEYNDQLRDILADLKDMFENPSFATAVVEHMKHSLNYPDDLVTKVFRALNNIKGFELEFFWGSYVQNRVYKTNGYVNGNEPPIFVNEYFALKSAGKLDQQFMMGLMIHESMHIAGWSHSDEQGRNIPYDIGDFVFERAVHFISAPVA